MSYHTQTDLFARSLRSRLMSLTPVHLEFDKENPRGIGGTSTTAYSKVAPTCVDDMMLLQMNQKSVFGMSYPPPTQDLPIDSDNLRNLALAIRFCSEPDLSHPSKNENHDFYSIYKQGICETDSRKRLKSCEDSDLFFDFDIDEESRNGEKTIQHVDEDNDVFSITHNENEVAIANCFSNSVCLEDMVGSKSTGTASVSTAYCSKQSSTPASDEEMEDSQSPYLVSEGMALHPKDWKCHINGSAINNDNTLGSRVNELTIKTTTEGNRDEQDTRDDISSKIPHIEIDNPPTSFPKEIASDEESSDEEWSEEDANVKVGSAEQKMANNKLMTLISLLEKDRDYSKNRKPETNKPRASRKNALTVGSVPNPDTAFHLGASPVNFSFLRGSKDNDRSSPPNKHAEANVDPSKFNAHKSSLLIIPSKLRRCESAPSLEEIDVQIVLPDEPANINTLTDTEMSLHEGRVDNRAIQEEKAEDEVDSKDKYRRCSSLKSGKTPPGSPGKRKIVRYELLLNIKIHHTANSVVIF